MKGGGKVTKIGLWFFISSTLLKEKKRHPQLLRERDLYEQPSRFSGEEQQNGISLMGTNFSVSQTPFFNKLNECIAAKEKR